MELTLGEKLKDERTNRKWTIKQVHNMLNEKYNYNLSEGKLSKLENDSLKYSSYDGIVYLAKLYNVNTDYLLGLSNEKTTNPTAQSAIEYTGLSENAVELLHNALNKKRKKAYNPLMPLVLSYIIEHYQCDEAPAKFYSVLCDIIWSEYRSEDNSKDIIVKDVNSNIKTHIDAEMYVNAALVNITNSLHKCRDQEKSDKPSEYRERYIEAMRKMYGGENNGKHN